MRAFLLAPTRTGRGRELQPRCTAPIIMPVAWEVHPRSERAHGTVPIATGAEMRSGAQEARRGWSGSVAPTRTGQWRQRQTVCAALSPMPMPWEGHPRVAWSSTL